MNLLTNNCSFYSDELMREIDKLISVYDDKVNPEGEIIAFHVDISRTSIIALLAAIKMGLKIALVPTREPSSVIAKWLIKLGCKKLFYSGSDIFVDEKITHYSLNLLLKNQSTYRVVNQHPHHFSSIMRTSGTMSEPKSALINADAHYHSARSVNDYFSFTTTDCWALTLPFFHVSGLSILFRALLAKSSVFIALSHENLLNGLSQNKITHLSLVPAQLKRLLDDNADFSHVKAVIVGGDGLSLKLRDSCLLKGIALFETYGLTETASMIWVHDSHKNEGKLLPHATLTLADDGEILVGGISMFEGYVTAPDELEKHMAGSDFKTGDIGHFKDHQLQLINRKNNRIISGGENIQAEEIEGVLEMHPQIVCALVIGINDQAFGKRPRAYIKWLKEPVADNEIRAFLSHHLAPYKIPKDFLSWPADAPAGLKKPRRWFSLLPQINT